MSGPSAGVYDPVKALFEKPVRGGTVSGEPTQDTWATFTSRHIRFLQKPTMDARREASVQKQQVSRDLLVIKCRRDSKTELIQVDMRMTHRGNVWQIVGVDNIDYSQDEVQLLCQRVNLPTTQP